MAGSSFYRAVAGDHFTVDVGRFAFRIPPSTASEWLVAVSDEDSVTAIIPGMLDDVATERLYNQVESERINLDDVRRGALDAIAAASGFRWWEAVRLAGMAEANNGEFFGRLIVKGVDPRHQSFGAWCSAAYSLALQGFGEDKERLKFTARFEAPPPGEEYEAGDSFESMVKAARAMPGMRVSG
jgi:hypothetical protein